MSIGSPGRFSLALRRDPESGFTLLEVLVAFAIVAISLAALIKGVGFGLGAVDAASRYEEAVSRAKSHLAALGPDVVRLIGVHRGDDGGGYRWQINVAPERVAPQLGGRAYLDNLRLYDVAVTISWKDGERLRRVTLRTARLGMSR
jgi:general secretion pathway protein I